MWSSKSPYFYLWLILLYNTHPDLKIKAGKLLLFFTSTLGPPKPNITLLWSSSQLSSWAQTLKTNNHLVVILMALFLNPMLKTNATFFLYSSRLSCRASSSFHTPSFSAICWLLCRSFWSYSIGHSHQNFQIWSSRVQNLIAASYLKNFSKLTTLGFRSSVFFFFLLMCLLVILLLLPHFLLLLLIPVLAHIACVSPTHHCPNSLEFLRKENKPHKSKTV